MIPKINHFEYALQCSSSIFEINSQEGYALIYLPNFKYFINFKHLRIGVGLHKWYTDSDYLIIQDSLSNIKIDFTSFRETWMDYDSFNVLEISSPVFVLHKKYIDTLFLDNEFEDYGAIIPTKDIKIKLNCPSSDVCDNILDYLQKWPTK